jgi:hypothetical protein
MKLVVVPAFQSEIVPAPIRGFIVGFYQLTLTLKGFVIHSVGRSTNGMQDYRLWYIPPRTGLHCADDGFDIRISCAWMTSMLSEDGSCQRSKGEPGNTKRRKVHPRAYWTRVTNSA